MKRQPTPLCFAHGDVLSSEQLYLVDIAPYHVRLSVEEEQALVHRARTRASQAREDLILYLLSGVECIASRYYTGYAKLWKRLEYLDLIQEGNRALVEKLTVALDKANPSAYLLATAEGAIRRYCFEQRTCIRTPQTEGVAPLLVESLDTPYFADVVAGLSPATETTREDSLGLSQAINQAADTLPLMQRTVITRHYGLHDTPAEAIGDLRRALYGNKRHKQVSIHKRLALSALRRKLAPTLFPKENPA